MAFISNPPDDTKPPAISKEFSSASAQVFSVGDSLGYLDLEARCPVLIKEGGDNKISVEILPNDEKSKSFFSVKQVGEVIFVREKGNMLSSSTSSTTTTISINGKTTFGSLESCILSGDVFKNTAVVLKNARVFVNGKEITGDKEGAEKSTTNSVPTIIIKAPKEVGLKAKLSGQSKLTSTVFHDEAHLVLSGQSEASMTARAFDLKLSGQSEVNGTVDGGNVNIDSSGQSEVHLNGSFGRVHAESSGMSEIETSGPVAGDYTAEASGMSGIHHRGRVSGRTREKASSMATVRLG